eukprot:c21969_g2_i1 orf=228-1409(+)
MKAESPSVLSTLVHTGSSVSDVQNCPASSLDLWAESVSEGEEVISVKRKADFRGEFLQPVCRYGEHDSVRYGLKGSGITTKESFVKSESGSCGESGSGICGEAQNLSPDTVLRMLDSPGTSWTDEKHSSYLNAIEEAFVRKMYDGEYCALDLCGRAAPNEDSSDQDCVESRPSSESWAFSYCKEFKALQWEGQHSVTFTKPLQLQIPTSSPLAVLSDPWIKHFRSTANHKADVSISHWQVNFQGSDTFGQDKRQGNKKLLQRMIVESHTEAAPVVVQDRLQSYLNSCNSSPQEIKKGLKFRMRCPAGNQLLSKHCIAQNCQFHNQGQDVQSTFWNSRCIPEVCPKSRKRHRQVGLKEMSFKISKRRIECKFSAEYSDQIVPNVYSAGAEEEAV